MIHAVCFRAGDSGFRHFEPVEKSLSWNASPNRDVSAEFILSAAEGLNMTVNVQMVFVNNSG